MKLSSERCWERIGSQQHGVLATLHPARGADLVPVVYAVVDGHVGVPVDRVKAKASTRLQRRRNLEHDPRATLLVEHWDPQDWSQLWWVRAQLRWREPGDGDAVDLAERLAAALAAEVPAYRDRPFAEVLVLRIEAVAGWQAG